MKGVAFPVGTIYQAWYLYVIASLCCLSVACSLIGFDIGLFGGAMFYLIALLFFTSIFLGTVFSASQGLIMVCYVSLSFLAFQLPMIGFSLGLNGSLSLSDVKIVIGLRPLLVASLLILLFMKYIFCFERSHNFIIGFVVISLALSFFVSAATVTDSGKYFINSFIPLFLGLILLALIIERPQEIPSSGGGGGSAAYFSLSFAILVLCFFYNLSLVFSYELFRPDLASAYRAEHRGYIDYGDYPASWKDVVRGALIIRMAGTFSDPIQFGYFCTFCSFFFMCSRSFLFKLVGAAFAYGLYLSASKGASICLAISLLLFFAHLRFKALFWPTVIAVTFVFLFLASSLSTSGKVHFAGLVGGLTSVATASPINMGFGYGIGAGGNLSVVSGSVGAQDHSWLLTGAESGFGVMVFQMGLSGVLCLFLTVRYFLCAVKKSNFLSTRSKSAVTSLMISYLVCFLLQENLINSSILCMFFLAICMLVHSDHNQRH